eukprot:TRINITY_DN7257_c0_g1_i1.p1 TRINITY_DN7257_c0_g1~~TRINITY_DN7257_c0_g1_i1.p1  ORF type:complete len:207 (+),score=31.41 TRINITY_DN7257_c0_g1_i1:209-829(+)
MFFEQQESPRETALAVVDKLGEGGGTGDHSVEEDGSNINTTNTSLPPTPGGEGGSPTADHPAERMVNPSMTKAGKLAAKYSVLLEQHKKLVTMCADFSLNIPYTTDLDMGFRNLSLLTTDAFATPAEGSPNLPPHHTSTTTPMRQPIAYFDAEMECPRILGTTTDASSPPSSPQPILQRHHSLHLMSTGEITSTTLTPHPPPPSST